MTHDKIGQNLKSFIFPTVPFGFFLVISILKYFETTFIGWFSLFLDFCGAYNPFNTGIGTSRSSRLWQNFTFLLGIACLSLITKLSGYGTYNDHLVVATSKVELEDFYFMRHLESWIGVTKKFVSTCAMMTIYRFYIDAAVQTFLYAGGYSTSDEPEMIQSRKDLIAYQKRGGVEDRNNGNMARQMSANQIFRNVEDDLEEDSDDLHFYLQVQPKVAQRPPQKAALKAYR